MRRAQFGCFTCSFNQNLLRRPFISCSAHRRKDCHHPVYRMADKDKDSGDEEELTIADDIVVTKYKMAGDMANGG